MNRAEHIVCSSSLWRYFTGRQLLPWVLAYEALGDHLLEIGAGSGAATAHLRRRVPRVTSLEYDHQSLRRLASQHQNANGSAVRGDAVRLPFASQTFSSVVAILVLHHLESREAQDRVFAEVFRVLRPGGVFLAFEITDSWLHRAGHFRSTFTPLAPGSAFARLNAAGFSRVAIDLRKAAFRISATRAERSELALSAAAGVTGYQCV
jgi:ubiquinone/menaquinone biosynthesis C-methylase UbiE